MGDLHKILQVRPGADDETIAAAYARLRRRYDPALGGPFADESALHELERAYAILSDPEARDAYEMTAGRGADRLSEDGPRVRSEAARATFPTPAARDPFGLEDRSTSSDHAPLHSESPDKTTSEAAPASDDSTAGPDLWRTDAAGAPQTAIPLPDTAEEGAGSPLTHSLGTLPRRERPTASVPSGGWVPGWARGRILPVASALLVILGGGLAIWGVLQAVDEAGDGSAPAESEAPPASQAEQSSDESSPDTLAAPQVASVDALPSDLREFAEGVIEDFEEDDGTRYRIYDFVATTTSDGEVFYAAMAIREDSDLIGQAVFFFVDESLLGRDWGEDVRSVDSIASLSGGRISVIYRLYEPDDEDCCPSGEPFAVVYTYDGEFIADSSTPPDGIFVE